MWAGTHLENKSFTRIYKEQEESYQMFIKKQEERIKNERLVLNPPMKATDKLVESFGLVAVDPRTTLKIDQDYFKDLKISYDFGNVEQKTSRGGNAYSVGGLDNLLTEEKLREAIEGVQGKTHTAPLIEKPFCHHHEKSLPIHKKKILEYKNKFKKISPAPNYNGPCLACRLNYK